jgi:Uri superfamily endonuclease
MPTDTIMNAIPSIALPPQLLQPGASGPGIYALLLDIESGLEHQIGQLGSFIFPAGSYVYIGSARGPGGVATRIRRHLNNAVDKRQHWHIDWFRQIAKPTGVIWTHANQASECSWAFRFNAVGVCEPAGFGASDCGCPGHLLRLDRGDVWNRVHRTSSILDEDELNMAQVGWDPHDG